MKYRYSVTYRQIDSANGRVVHRSVIAQTADEARRMVRALDPLYLTTIKSLRTAKVIEVGL